MNVKGLIRFGSVLFFISFRVRTVSEFIEGVLNLLNVFYYPERKLRIFKTMH